MLRPAQICKECTILGNLRTITRERKKEIRQMTPFFSSTFWALTVCDIHFCIWKLPKFIFMGSSFRPFWSAKHLNFGGVSWEIRILSRSIQKTHIKESKKIGSTFSFELRTKFAWCYGLLLLVLECYFAESKVWMKLYFSLFSYLNQLYLFTNV